MSDLDDASNDPDTRLEYENMDLENFVLQNFTEELESRKRSAERVDFHNHSSKALFSLVEGTQFLLYSYYWTKGINARNIS